VGRAVVVVWPVSLCDVCLNNELLLDDLRNGGGALNEGDLVKESRRLLLGPASAGNVKAGRRGDEGGDEESGFVKLLGRWRVGGSAI